MKAQGKDKVWDPAKARVEATRMLVGNFDNWPAWPILPMRHEQEMERGARLLGCMTEEDSDTYNVYLLNMFEVTKPGVWENAEVRRFDTIEDLIDNGWRVD